MEQRVREILGLPYKNLFSYWQHYWGRCIDRLTDKDNVSFKIVGPRLLLNDLIDELEGHGLASKDNICFFKSQVLSLDKTDEVFHAICHPLTTSLLQKLGDRINREACILLCKKALGALVEKQYFSRLVDWLAKFIDEAPESNFDSRKKINDITHLVIAEYVAEGFVLDEIKNYSTDVPGVLRVEDGDVIEAPEEFETIKKSDFSSETEYYAAVAQLIGERDVYKCLDVLKYYYSLVPRKAYFIVRLIGLKGQIDDYIGDINIYSPKIKRYIKDDSFISDIEKLPEGRDWVNAAIPVDFVSFERAKASAIKKMEEVLDVLMLTYRTNTPISIATNHFSVVAEDHEIACSNSVHGNDPTMASRDEGLSYFESLDLSEVKGDDFKFLTDKHRVLEVGQGALKIRLKNAAHWYSKAVTSEKDVDVLLFSWFAIEGLLKVETRTQSQMIDHSKEENPLKVIQEFVSSILCRQHFHNYLRGTYWDFLIKTDRWNNYYDISEDVISWAALNLKAGDHFQDGAFLNAIPELIACINDDIVKDELTLLNDFYQDDKGLKIMASQIKEDLLMIYRLRNMIAHNAVLSCVNIAYYAREATYIAQRVIRYVIDKAVGDKTIDEIVLGAKLDYEVFMKDYNNELKKIRDRI